MTQTFTQDVLIDGSQDIEQLRVQGHAVQNDALQTWEASDNTVLAQVTGDGRLQIGDDLGMATPDSMIEVHRAENTTPSKPKRGFHSLGRITGALTEVVAWAVQELELLGNGGISALHSALRVKLTNQNTGAMDVGADLRAGDFEVVNAVASADSVTTMTAVQAKVTNASGASIDKAIALRAGVTNAGQITKSYAVYTDEGTIHFSDPVEIGQPLTTPPNIADDNTILIYPKLDGKLYARNWIEDVPESGIGQEFDLTGGQQQANGLHPGLLEGRLSLQQDSAVPATDQSGNTVYLLPYKGNRIALYDGANWQLLVLPSLPSPLVSLSLPTLGGKPGEVYNLYLYDNNGVPTLEAESWTQYSGDITSISTTREVTINTGGGNTQLPAIDDIVMIFDNNEASNNGQLFRVYAVTNPNKFQLRSLTNAALPAASQIGYNGKWRMWSQSQNANLLPTSPSLDTIDGVLVKAGNPTRRYLGVVRLDWQLSPVMRDTFARRLLWNYYNRVPRRLLYQQAYSHSVSTSNTWRAWGNDLDNRIDFVVGQGDSALVCGINGYFSTGVSAHGRLALDLDKHEPSLTLFERAAGAYSDSGVIVPALMFETNLLEGHHHVQALEAGTGSTLTSYTLEGFIYG